ncbi:MAG: hypothetical protein AABY93_08565 [Bacteroidota bacterium]
MNLYKDTFKGLSLAALVALLAISGCKKDAPSSQEVIKSRMISTSWEIKAVSIDGVDKTSMYAGMTLQFTPTTYTATKGGVIWPSSGTWSFNSDDGTTILRNDGLELTVQVTDATLDTSLYWQERTLGGGRLNSLQGNHVFSFSKL